MYEICTTADCTQSGVLEHTVEDEAAALTKAKTLYKSCTNESTTWRLEDVVAKLNEKYETQLLVNFFVGTDDRDSNSHIIHPFNWTYFTSKIMNTVNITVPDSEKIINYSPNYYRKLNVLLEKYSKRDLQNYMVWRFAMNMVVGLSRAYRDTRKAFRKARAIRERIGYSDNIMDDRFLDNEYKDIWCGTHRPKQAVNSIKVDVHSPGQFSGPPAVVVVVCLWGPWACCLRNASCERVTGTITTVYL
uniref:Peptidase M13 N-terminal domain-containing protein n=1 Tax=Knipowitschia caucasica TaxID=637954 RepID=A0AAV2J116_KNICA